MSYSVIYIDQIEGAGPGGAVRFVRRQLGAEAFGISTPMPSAVPSRARTA